MIWLWGINLWVFAQSSVNYAKVFDLAQTHLSHRDIWRVFLSNSFLCIFVSKVLDDFGIAEIAVYVEIHLYIDMLRPMGHVVLS
jgi:hypothetical protein